MQVSLHDLAMLQIKDFKIVFLNTYDCANNAHFANAVTNNFVCICSLHA